MEKIGVVTVTYNSENVIKPFLENLYAQSFTNFNLYIIDNASTDSTLDILNNLNDNRICQIRNENNLGVAAANNIGIKKALSDKCTHVLIVNNDIEFNAKLLENMLSSFNKNNCGLVTPKSCTITIKIKFGMQVEDLKKVMAIYLIIMVLIKTKQI